MKIRLTNINFFYLILGILVLFYFGPVHTILKPNSVTDTKAYTCLIINLKHAVDDVLNARRGIISIDFRAMLR